MRVDSEREYYRQEWFDLHTGETTWGPKEGKLSDPDMHGESQGDIGCKTERYRETRPLRGNAGGGFLIAY